MDGGSDCEIEKPAKLDIQIISDWLLICLTFVAKSPGAGDFRSDMHPVVRHIPALGPTK